MAMDFTDVLMLGLMLVQANTPARAGMSPERSEPGGRGPRLETKVAFRYVPGMAHTGRREPEQPILSRQVLKLFRISELAGQIFQRELGLHSVYDLV